MAERTETPTASNPSSQNAAVSHAGISLDFRALEATSADELSAGHEGPIPWKTGEVGVVRPIDRAVSVVLSEPRAAAATKKASTGKGCGEGCGCAKGAAPERPAETGISAAAVAERAPVGDAQGGPGRAGGGSSGSGEVGPRSPSSTSSARS